ncbi:APC family permease, partial [Arenicella sp.]|nr:APC family permease [Arenicella sp.]
MIENHKNRLDQLAATAICGNDISSSVLYVSAVAIVFAGQYAWITLLIVSFVLFLYRKIYAEVVGALPANGGAYNALLNTTSKSVASVAAALTLLSYMATAVISANEAIHYIHHLVPALPVIPVTILLLGLFALLTIVGISESAKVAIGIFIFHLGSLLILSVFILFYLSQTGLATFFANWQMPLSDNQSILGAILLGFGASMLGVSGFESSANFVERQKRGVFPKTLRNMWIIVSVINPLMAIFALSMFSIPELQSDQYQNTLILQMGHKVGGLNISALIAIDAFLVLSGAVLTSYIGVVGLLERLTLDRIMPPFFFRRNKRGSSYAIILSFFFLCVSVLLITKGNVILLAGVYSISFLSVMGLFAIGNILLKIRRANLPRPERASWIAVLVAIAAVAIALVANIVVPHKEGLPSNLTVFMYYFIPTILLTAIMLNRIILLRMALNLVNSIFIPIRRAFLTVDKQILRTIDSINSQEFVFFTKGDDIEALNNVMLYMRKNEHTRKLKIVTVVNDGYQ